MDSLIPRLSVRSTGVSVLVRCLLSAQCLLLKTLHGIPDFGVVVPTGSSPLLENPPTRGTNTKAQFGIAKGGQEFSVYGVALLPQGLDAA